MANTQTPVFRSPVAAGSSTAPATMGATSALSLADETGVGIVSVRNRDEGSLSERFATRFGRATRSGNTLMAGQRPGECIIMGDRSGVVGLAASKQLAGDAVVELTHGRVVLRVTGAQASSTLEKVCSLDWSDAMMPNGAVTSGSVAKVTCDVIRDDAANGTRSYLLTADRSFGQYLFDALVDAGDEFGIVVG